MKYWARATEALKIYIQRGENLEAAIRGGNHREAIELFRTRDAAFSNYRAYLHLAEKSEGKPQEVPESQYSSLVETAAQQNEKLKTICEEFVRNLTADQRRLVKFHQSVRGYRADDIPVKITKLAN